MTQQLTELQIKQLHKYISDTILDIWRESEDPKPFMIEFARAIERAHGIDK